MPTLNWIGKEKVVTHHLDVPYRVLERKYTFGDTPDSGNMIIHGDNLEALKALLPQYEGKIKCIYIDPPYNTGNEGWVYNDNVNDPHIRKWLGRVVGSEMDDLTRHDKWLCMMYPRLKLLYNLLAPDGVIFISIDENEFESLKIICDEIWSRSNYVGMLTWESTTQPTNAGKARFNLQKKVEPILMYRKSALRSTYLLEELESKCNYPHIGRFGACRFEIIEKSDAGGYNRETMKFPILGMLPREGKRWQIGEDTAKDLEKEGKVEIVNGIVKRAIYPEDEIDKRKFRPFWSHFDAKTYGTAQSGKELLNTIMGRDTGFDTIKPPELIAELISHLPKDSIVLDCFAGSGTTAHAVLLQNSKDGGNRRFILVEKMDYVESIAAERIRRVITGYNFESEIEEEVFSERITIKNITNSTSLLERVKESIAEKRKQYKKIGKPVIEDSCIKVFGTKKNENSFVGLGGSFDFYELGEAIFDSATGLLNDNVDTEQIRRYVWFTETNSPYIKPGKDSHPYFLGSFQHSNYYFYYNKDKETCLDPSFLKTFTLKDKAEMYIIYADRCVLTEEKMVELNIRFKKIPRDIKRV